MIARLQGRLVALEAQRAVVEAGGVGYEVAVGPGTFAFLQAQDGRDVVLHVHSHWKDGELHLYGFERLIEKQLFARLTEISGVGPAIGLAILSAQRAEDLVVALASGDGAMLERVPRVGKKLASRIVLEVRDKLKDLYGEAMASAAPPRGGLWNDLVSALVNLGYRHSDAERTASELRAEGGIPAEGGDFSEALRKALSRLSAR
jgi:Holliday junction DNA helicase RuvA